MDRKTIDMIVWWIPFRRLRDVVRCTLNDIHSILNETIDTKNKINKILSKENIELIQKIENVSQKTIRDKLLTYLSNEAQKKHSNSFEIQFNRQDLADYLNVDRSAMSFELSKLQKEGLIEYNKNKFELKS